MDNFAAIDFETANNERTSICSVGVVIVRNGEIADRFYSLVHPEPDYYLYWNTRIHGLTQEDTAHAPVFSEVWKQVAPKIEGLPLVAHNKAFDEGYERFTHPPAWHHQHHRCVRGRRHLVGAGPVAGAAKPVIVPHDALQHRHILLPAAKSQ